MISSFKGKHRFLSNFYPVYIRYEGDIYASVEHAYQAAKTLDVLDRARVRNCRLAVEAKRMGRRLTLRSNWEAIKLETMHTLVSNKFVRSPSLKTLLLLTFPETLIEGNDWGDTFWGICNGVGENHLGEILMRVRDELNEIDIPF